MMNDECGMMNKDDGTHHSSLSTPHFKDSGIEWLGEIPEHWEIKKVKYLFRFVSGGTPSTTNLEYWTGEIPWVSSKDMKSFYLTDTEDHINGQAVEESATTLLPESTVLLVMRSGILRHTIPVAVIQKAMAINQDIKGLLPEQGQMFSDYFARFVQGHQNQLLALWRKEGTTVESLETESVTNFQMIIPALPEQRAIAAFLDRETARIDGLIKKVEESMTLLREYRTALISAAVTGKIDVRGEVGSRPNRQAAKEAVS